MHQAILPFEERFSSPPAYRPSAAQERGREALLAHGRRFARAASGLTTVLLTGPEGSGKSRLATEVMAETRAEITDECAPPMVHEDAVNLGADTLFVAINEAAERRAMLVIEHRLSPRRWFAEGQLSPDLASRLASAPHIVLDPPSAETMEAALSAELARRGYRFSADDIAFAASRLPRRFNTLQLFCARLERATLGGSKRAVLHAVLDDAAAAGWAEN